MWIGLLVENLGRGTKQLVDYTGCRCVVFTRLGTWIAPEGHLPAQIGGLGRNQTET